MFTTTEAAALLGVTVRAVRAHIKRGNIRATRFGRDWQITPEEIERFKRQRRPAHRPKKHQLTNS